MIPTPYGHCPYCGGRGLARERRPNGDDRCENGHSYPSREAVAEASPVPEAWSCLGCGQRNSGWSHECGRCGVKHGARSKDPMQPIIDRMKQWAELRAEGWSTPGETAEMQREIERLRLALAEEIAGRLDRALSPQNKGRSAGD